VTPAPGFNLFHDICLCLKLWTGLEISISNTAKKIASLALSGAEAGNQFTMPLLINVF